MHRMAMFTTATLITGLSTALLAAQAQSTQPNTAQQQTATAGTAQPSEAGQDATRQKLAAARQALTELTQLPAAAQLQGEPREMISKFITDFNAFATASTDWRAKYHVVDTSLDRMLESAGTRDTGAAAPATESGAGGFDADIAAKLREMRTHLDEFEAASGDPLFLVDALEQTLDEAMNGTGGDRGMASSTGAGAAPSASAADGVLTVDRAKLEELSQQIERLRQALLR